MEIMNFVFGIGMSIMLVASGISVLAAMWYRRVVSTNMVHIVQSRRATTPYGTGQKTGNVYYAWPSWLPVIGVTVIELPVSNFEIDLGDYEAYDKDLVPFLVDVVAFFRIKDTALAAQRVANITELKQQLSQIVQGAVRKVLASDVIDKVMVERAQFGDAFTEEVAGQLDEWGVESIKSMELMDIRDDARGEHKAVSNIMAKKVSHIDMESRKEVANNHRDATTAEIEKDRAIEIAEQEKLEAVGKRTAERNKMVGIANKQSEKEVYDAEKATKEAAMEVERVRLVKQAEITSDQQVVEDDRDKQAQVIRAEGSLEAAKLDAEGVRVAGEAEGKAKEAVMMAPVTAQISLAREIGGNAGYQMYLVQIEAIKAYLEVGGKQAAALEKADVKVIANSGSPMEGVRGGYGSLHLQGRHAARRHDRGVRADSGRGGPARAGEREDVGRSVQRRRPLGESLRQEVIHEQSRLT